MFGNHEFSTLAEWAFLTIVFGVTQKRITVDMLKIFTKCLFHHFL